MNNAVETLNPAVFNYVKPGFVVITVIFVLLILLTALIVIAEVRKHKK